MTEEAEMQSKQTEKDDEMMPSSVSLLTLQLVIWWTSAKAL